MSFRKFGAVTLRKSRQRNGSSLEITVEIRRFTKELTAMEVYLYAKHVTIGRSGIRQQVVAR